MSVSQFATSTLRRARCVLQRAFGKRLPPIDLSITIAALHAAAADNLAGLLAGAPPRPLAPMPVRRRLGLRRFHAGLPGGLLAGTEAAPAIATLVAEPQRAVQAGQTIGAATLLPVVLHTAFADRHLAHRLGRFCHDHLSDHVLFHPDPAPFPRFSPLALARLTLSQPGHRSGTPPAVARALDQALAEMDASAPAPGFWDQWLYRRMAATPGWNLPDALRRLPLVNWTPDHPPPDPATAESWPACWPSLESRRV